MYLKHLVLRHFRNYARAEISFSPGTNWIQGANGQGKTNLLEAIHLLSTGRSFRASALSDLIHFQERFFYIEGHFVKEGVEQEIKVYYDETTRKVQHNQTVYPTLTSLLGILPSILLSPDDLSLITGSPAERRRFLDLYIAQTDPLYLHHLGRYFKAMRQRNALLKMRTESTLDAWETTMAESAEYLLKKRELAIEELKSPLSIWMQRLSCQRDSLTIQYASSLSPAHRKGDVKSHLQQLFKKGRPKEMILGSTLIGPHRDDFLLCLENKQAKLFSSEGQKRSCVSSLRFAQWEQIQTLLQAPPLLGIDDFGIQLDGEREKELSSHLAQFQQVFLTSPHPPKEKNLSPTAFCVSAGTVSML